MAEGQFVRVEREGAIAVVTIDRPKVNALNRAVIDELTAVFGRLDEDAAVGVVVLTGGGDKAFVAGADIGELAPMDRAAGLATARRGQALMQRISDCRKPVIAAVNGFALGGGLELALACDMRFAATTAKLGLPEVTLGIIPGYGGTQRLARLCGTGAALQLILTAEPVGADEALRIGLVNGVSEPGELLAHCKKVAAGMLAKSGAQAIARAKQAVHQGLDRTLADGLSLEAELFAAISGTPEMKEGMAAFLEKRKPGWLRG